MNQLIDLNELKTFLRIDEGSDQESLLPFLIEVAKKKLKKSGVPEIEDEDYKMAVMLHVAISMGHTEYEKMLHEYVLTLKVYGGEETNEI